MELLEGKTMGIPSPDNVSTKQQRIAELARQMPDRALTSLAHHIDIEWMKEAFRRTRKDGAPGTDGQTAKDYEAGLEANLQSLLNRAKAGTYRAPPVRRVHIPKGNGETRPIGIPNFEDKVLQRAAVMALEPVYEQDFLECSYGFRPGRSAHQALASLWSQLMKTSGGWVVEVDISKFFDTLDHGQVQAIVRQRVSDGVLLRLIGKWLNAGVQAEGVVSYPEAGTPQGGVISPLLANIYLHEVLDRWLEQEVKPRMDGEVFLVRYADDFVIGCTREHDARRIMNVLPKRFGRYGLTLHPDKTRLVPFRNPQLKGPSGGGKSGSFDFLGFTHLWSTSWRGVQVIKRRTAKGRFRRALTRVAEWCRSNRHRPLREQQQVLNQKLRGHYGYYGITGNSEALQHFKKQVQLTWSRWLRKRGGKRRGWLRIWSLIQQRFPLAKAIAVHSALRRSTANP